MKKLILLVPIFILIIASSAFAKTSYFEYPKVHEDFCGAKIDYRICKCARHNQMCKDIGMERNAASEKLRVAFDEYVKAEKGAFGRSCMANGGIYSVLKAQCEYCESNEVRSEGVCKNPKDVRPLEQIYSLPKVESVGGTQIVGYVILGEGEFFLYSPGRGKWIGPISGGGLQIFQGDVLHTTINGRAQIRLGRDNMYIMERSTLYIPSPQRERTFLERGALFVWDSLKRLATNTPYDIEEGGAHSITGRKGTTFMIESEPGEARYAVKDGAIDVWTADNPEAKREVAAGGAALASAAGVSEAPYAWNEMLTKYELTESDFAEPEDVANFAPIDPDAVNPSEAAYTGDLAGDVKTQSGGFGSIFMYVLIAVVAIVGYFFVRRYMRQRVKTT